MAHQLHVRDFVYIKSEELHLKHLWPQFMTLHLILQLTKITSESVQSDFTNTNQLNICMFLYAWLNWLIEFIST